MTNYNKAQYNLAQALLQTMAKPTNQQLPSDEFNAGIDLSVTNQAMVACEAGLDKKHHIISWEDWH